jgi:hypothetical protein
LVVIGTDCTGSLNPTTIRSQSRRPLETIESTDGRHGDNNDDSDPYHKMQNLHRVYRALDELG